MDSITVFQRFDCLSVAGKGLGNAQLTGFRHQNSINVPTIAIVILEHMPLNRKVFRCQILCQNRFAVKCNSCAAANHPPDLPHNDFIGGEFGTEGISFSTLSHFGVAISQLVDNIVMNCIQIRTAGSSQNIILRRTANEFIQLFLYCILPCDTTVCREYRVGKEVRLHTTAPAGAALGDGCQGNKEIHHGGIVGTAQVLLPLGCKGNLCRPLWNGIMPSRQIQVLRISVNRPTQECGLSQVFV